MSDDADDPQAGDPQEQFDQLSDNEKVDHLERQASEDETHGKQADPHGHADARNKIAGELLPAIDQAVEHLNDLVNLTHGMDADQLHDAAEQKQIHGLSATAAQSLQALESKLSSALSEAQSAGIYASAIEMSASSARKALQELNGANTKDANSLYGSYKQAWSDASSTRSEIQGFQQQS